MFPLRPKPNETEEDLLRFQEEFLQSGSRPAARVIKKQKTENTKRQNVRPTRDIVRMDGSDTSGVGLSEPAVDFEFRKNRSVPDEKPDEDVEQEMDRHDTHLVAVLGKITEKNTSYMPVTFPGKRSQAFPSVFQRNLNHVKSRESAEKLSTKARQSIFSQQFREKSLKDFGIAPRGDPDMNTVQLRVEPSHLSPLKPGVSIEKLKDMFPSPNVVTGKGLSGSPYDSRVMTESRKIHEESLQKMSTMSESEILSERQKLFHELNPELINFLQNKSKQKAKLKEEILLEELIETSKEEKPNEVEERIMECSLSKQSEDTPVIPMNVDEKWVHMDEIESDKLAWTSMIPQKERKEVTLSHRFDFNGNIVTDEDDIPVHLGLHHHGEEPDAAGYTLKEIFILSRSNFTQQRVFAVTLIGKILAKVRCGKYSLTGDKPILSSLLDSGLIFLLRWSLDEQSENMIQASVRAMHSLLCKSATETFSNTMFSRSRGCEMPALCPEGRGSKKDDESDYEIAQRDVIAGLVKITILQRLRYIMEVCSPSPQTINHCLDILIRICRHSTQYCVAVFECPRLIAFVVDTLIQGAYKKPNEPEAITFPKAARLLSTICIGGRHATSRMLNDFPNIVASIRHHVVEGCCQELADTTVNETEMEMCRFWIICISYGSLHELFWELYGVIMVYIKKFVSILPTNSDQQKIDVLAKRCQLVFLLFNKMFVSHSPTSIPSWQEICLSVIVAISRTLEVRKLRKNETCSKLDTVMSTALEFLATYYGVVRQSKEYDAPQVSSSVEAFANDVLLPVFRHLTKLRFPVQFDYSSGETVPSLPEYSIPDNMNGVKFFNLYASFLKCCVSVCRLNRSCCMILVPVVFSVAKKCTWLSSGVHRRVSFDLIGTTDAMYWAVELFILVATQHPDEVDSHTNFYHSVAFRCFGRLCPGDEHLMHHMMSSVLFHPVLLKGEKSCDTECMSTPTPGLQLGTVELSTDDIASLALSCIPAIRSMYMSSFHIDSKVLEQSKFRFLCKEDSITKFLLPSHPGPSAPSDWPFIPLLQLYNLCVNGADAPAKFVPHISYCLYYICLLESRFQTCLAPVSLTAKIVRLMCVFLAGNDIFLESSVKRCLSFLFRHYCQNASKMSLDFTRQIPGISSFYDFFVSLLEHYEGVSYGDDLFTSVVLLPLHRANGNVTDTHKALWCDHQDVLRIMSLPIDKLLLPASWYLFPVEKDGFMIRTYVSALAREHCSRQRSPVPYLIAVHHTASFMFSDEVDVSLKAKKEAYRGVLKLKNEEVRKHILNYVSPDPGSSLGFIFTDCAADERNRLIALLGQ